MKTLKLNGTQSAIVNKMLLERRDANHAQITRLQNELNEINLLISDLHKREVKLVAGNVKTKASEQKIARERLGEARRIINADSKVVRE